MSISEDLINFDIIETQKENIQSLPQGRSAKALASAFATSPFSPAPTPGSTRTLNDALRAEYEKELLNIADSDDPLDVYDRYVKWTLNAYPSAQATPESQLRPLLERATKAFQAASHYKNDPRYLRLWMHYIRFFSDAPRETFAYLARHSIGEGLALFYEDFAAWLEGAGRWTQAEEVYKLGIEREARPAERLLRKFGEFQQRFERRPEATDGPSSPALPTVRPALAAKVDPFAASTPSSNDPQAQRLPAPVSSSRSSKPKLAIFSDADAPALVTRPGSGDAAKGWDSIGSIEDRRKENTVEARPWAGETLKVGKKAGAVPKMMVFKDESISQTSQSIKKSHSNLSNQQQTVNPRTGKTERVFVDLDAVYPNPADLSEEYSFDELRARSRGWLEKQWSSKTAAREVVEQSQVSEDPTEILGNDSQQDTTTEVSGVDQTLSDVTGGGKEGFREVKSDRPRRKKVMEVKGETQTVMANLASPTGPKFKRKKSAEPTMTLHTKAATEDILDIFNQPLRNIKPLGADMESVAESDYDEDDYTSGIDSTYTGRISGATSECGEDVTGPRSDTGPEVTDVSVTDPKSISPWSDFTRSKHVPALDDEDTRDGDTREGGTTDQHTQDGSSGSKDSQTGDEVVLTEGVEEEISKEIVDEEQQLVTPILREGFEDPHTRFIPIPPEDFEVPTHPYRDAAQVSQARLPFMTPIVEKTESSINLPSGKPEKDYFTARTPSRQRDVAAPALPEMDNLLLSSPLREITSDAVPAREQKPVEDNSVQGRSRELRMVKSPIIKDMQCNPVEDSIRKLILDNSEPSISSLNGYHDHRPAACNKSAEIRRFVKAPGKSSKAATDRTSTNVTLPPTLVFSGTDNLKYVIKRELGKGAFAPVYLAAETTSDSEGDISSAPLLAIKAEEPPTAWEFYIMSLAHARLSQQKPSYPSSTFSSTYHRATASIATPHSLHLFSDTSFLLETYHDQGTLLDLANLAKADGSPGGVLDEVVAMFFSVELLRTLEALHSVGIIHGDLKPDNCLVRLHDSAPEDGGSGNGSHPECWSSQYAADGSSGWAGKGVALIDFGRGIDMQCFRAGVGFVADWKTGKQDCVEMREMRPWSWQVDYWGCAGVLHVLLFGKWIEDVAVSVNVATAATAAAGEGGEDGGGRDTTAATAADTDAALPATGASVPVLSRRYRLREPLKRYWQTELWGAAFDVLLNPGAHASASASASASGAGMPVLAKIAAAREGLEAFLAENAERKGLRAMLRRVEERLADGRRK